MRVLAILLMCGLFACQQNVEDKEPAQPPAPQTEPPPAPAVEEAAPQMTPTKAMMRGHFEQAGEAREALIRADIASAKTAMNWLATHKLGVALPESLRPMLTPMQQSAAEFSKATNLREAGVALAQTLTKCGDCHDKAGKGPTFAVPPLPEGKDAVHHMQRHHWAAERMWEGLVKRDPEAFEAAANAMAEGPIAREQGGAQAIGGGEQHAARIASRAARRRRSSTQSPYSSL